MTSLPINVNSSKPATAPAANFSAGQQGTQEFGNVLAQQISSNDSPAQPAEKQVQPVNNSATDSREDDSNATAGNAPNTENPALVSAEMLASLLAQPVTNSQDNYASAQNLPEEISALRKNTKTGLPQWMDDNSAIAGQTGESNVLHGSQPGLPASAQTGPLQELMQGVQTAGKTSALAEMAQDQAFAGHSPADFTQFVAANPHALQPSHSTPPGASTQIATPLHHPAWPDELGQKVSWIATQQNQSAELHLNPPQLGPLDITLKMNGDQASALFSSPHAAVREALENALPRLREILADNGITLGQAMVSDQSAQQNRDKAAQSGNKLLSTDDNMENPSVLNTNLPPVRRLHGMVDTFV